MSLKAINPTLTRAGMRAIFNASDAGLHAKITHLAFGSSRYTPTGTENGLKSEKARIEIVGSRYLDDFQMEITAKIDGPTGFTLAELGVMLEDGTLLAVWSDPDTPLAQYTPGVPIAFSFVLALSSLPQDIIKVTGDVDLQLFFGEEFTQLGTALIGMQLQNQQLTDRVSELEKRQSHMGHTSIQVSRLEENFQYQQVKIDSLLELISSTGALTLTNSNAIFESKETLQ
ncbi:phage tail protein [Pseudovibrio sp. Tun.PSC04-5.I4]|uniref:phage tail-collar fiber domain-containing protein n=1 Tax=Pseudovibrio sp. Tun.PSC04-5.I4 TaxID=1798213 RepID=UPI00088113AD|nr:phage tail protein [Pseudovibrio sp. Tun.PSC04-5.I4]SDR15350.1 Phage tail-collar fibre protein [Pseudovibrio sp. Tun.PSC04-5.I4]